MLDSTIMMSQPSARPGRPSPAGFAGGFVGRFVGDIARLLRDRRVRDFCDRLSAVPTREFAKSWIGINGFDRELLDLKVYFTFYELPEGDLPRILPDAGMRSDFLAAAGQASLKHVGNPLQPGSGYTFCIKVDRRGDPTYGFYLRVGKGRTGIFRLYGRKSWVKEYSYVSGARARAALERRFGLPPVAGCEVIEHGKGRGHGFESGDGDEKIILIGDFEKIRGQLFDAGEREALAAVESAYGLRAACGGIYRNGVKSAYLAGPRDEAGNRVRTVETLYQAAGN